MTLFAELIADVRDRKTSITNNLSKAKDIAHRLKSHELLNWVNAELRGYGTQQGAVPDYRITTRRGVAYVRDVRYMVMESLVSVHLPVQYLTGRVGEFFKNYGVCESISEVETLARTLGEEELRYLSPEFVDEVRRQSHLVGIPPQEFRTVGVILCRNTYVRILEAVHDRLYDFLLQLRGEYPKLADDERAYEQVRSLLVDRLVQTLILNIQCPIGEQSMEKTTVTVRDQAKVGNLVVAERIRDSFNKVTGSAATNSVKDLFKELADALAAAESAIPKEKQDSVAEDYAAMAAEAAKPGAMRVVLEAIGNRLVKTVEVAGKLAEPVAKIVAAILSQFPAT